MTRLRRLAARLHRASADVLVGSGIVMIAVGVGLAWVPAGFVVAGVALVMVARYGTEAG